MDDGTPYIVMELLEGSLRDKLNECKRLKYRAILKLANEIASALAYLHPSIVHRDLKPQNILMDANGVAKVADFGIAKFKQSTYLNTTRGNGTPAYMAPETFGSDKISEKADVFSLGMILWQMYSQQPLWGNEAEALAALGGAGLSQQHRLDPPMGCVTDVQARHLIGRMLQRKPAERIDVAHILRHGYLSGGMDTVEMDETFGPLHKGFVFARSLLQQQLNKAGIGER